MEQPNKPADAVTLSKQFRFAKIQHYLSRAEEFVRMHRYVIARQTLQKVLCIDSSNKAANSLEKRIEYSVSLLSRHSDKTEKLVASPDNGPCKRRRDELVMIVDQDEHVLGSLTERLTSLGFEVVCAAGYQEAIETLSFITPDVVISEVNFENGSVGFDLYLWIRTNNATTTKPFLFLATKINRDMLIAGKRLGVDDFIEKPLDEDVVTASIYQCLARHKKNNGLT